MTYNPTKGETPKAATNGASSVKNQAEKNGLDMANDSKQCEFGASGKTFHQEKRVNGAEYDFFDRIAMGQIDPPPASPIRYGVRADQTEGLAFLTVSKSEVDLTAEECFALAQALVQVAAELDTQIGGAA